MTQQPPPPYTWSGPPVPVMQTPPSVPAGRLPWPSVLAGLVIGVVLATAAIFLVVRPAASGAGAVELSVDVLPETVLGRTRADLEIKDKRPELAQRIRDLATGQMSSYATSYGGPGIDMAYGTLVGRQLVLVAVNGDLNLPIAQSAVAVERYASITPGTPVAVTGTSTTSCVYGPTSLVAGNGQPAAEFIAQVLSTAPASGQLICVRRDAARNFSVELSATNASLRSPADAAIELAGAVDQVWDGLVKR